MLEIMEKSGGGVHITGRVKPEVGQNGSSLCGIKSIYNGLSKTSKVLDISVYRTKMWW